MLCPGPSLKVVLCDVLVVAWTSFSGCDLRLEPM